MSVSGEVVVAIRGVDEASSAMDKVRASLGVFSGVIGDLGGGFTSLGNVISGFAGAGVMGAASAAVGEVVKGLQDCFKSATQSEEVWNRLAATVERSGVSWESARTSIESFASSAEKMTRFSDEQIAAAMKTLIDHGMSVEQAMKAMTQTMDLAAAKQVSLGEAANAVGKAFIGMERPLRSMGVVLDESVPKGKEFATAMEMISQKFGGAAQADVESYAGKQQMVANAFDNLKERIGSALIPVMNSLQDMWGKVVLGADQFVTDLGKVWKGFTELPEVQKMAEGLNKAWLDLQKGFATIADEVGKAMLPVFKELWSALKGIWDALQPVFQAFGKIWEALTGVSTEGKNAYTVFNLIADILKVTVVPALQGLVEVIKLVTPVIKLLAEGFKATVEIVAPIIRELIELIGGFVNSVKEILGGFWKWLVGGSFIQDLMDAVFTAFSEGIGRIIEGAKGWLAGVTATFAEWGQGILDFFGNLWNQMIDIVGNAFSGILKKVQEGINAVANFFGDLWKKLTGGSIWLDMWADMVKATGQGMQGILAETQRGLGRIESTFGGAALSLSPAAGFTARGAGAPAGQTTMHIPITITIQSMTGEVKDLENLTRMISRELGSAMKWRR